MDCHTPLSITHQELNQNSFFVVYGRSSALKHKTNNKRTVFMNFPLFDAAY